MDDNCTCGERVESMEVAIVGVVSRRRVGGIYIWVWLATTYGCLRYPEGTVRYGREKCQDATLRPRVPPLSNVPCR